ncbi:unnamed protein product [Heterobilharzia americana]|nr:unnamed protein product [Heterobilharzia americana]
MVISLSAVIIAIIICLTTILLYWVSLKKKLKNVLFIGICDSGKTTLFSSIVYGSPSTTFTSLNENVANLQVNKKALVLVDVPGHEKVRNEIIQKYKVDTLALIFVIDSKTVQSDIKDIAEFLYNVLVDKDFIKNRAKLLIACNKQDTATAKGISVITNLLEKEL